LGQGSRGLTFELDQFWGLGHSKITTQHKWSRKYGDAPYQPPKRLAYDISRPVHHASVPDSFQEGVLYEQPLWTPLQSGKNDVLIQPPQSFNNPDNRNCILDLESSLWEGYPKRQSVANAIKSQSRFSRYGLTTEVAFSNRPEYLTINLPSEWETLELYFADYGYDIALSSDGKYAMSFVKLIGGFKFVAKLREPDWYKLLVSLTPRNPTKLAQHIVQHLEVADRSSDDFIDRITEAIRVPVNLRPLASY
jgi:hypothetical protein